ncbi:methylated-DNA--[protein]-cysteine S-methyltransferase [Salinisphaera sp. SPP-AMP-43]|uniref:methylated-DNA--[protein]-cysteine S-methyltransferase n=1 Tax=Salinisphaera sp. SPP-AMP-43 TaxID=3121288 RepID=UPI003C6E92B6
MTYAVTHIDSPIGPLQAVASAQGLVAIGWPNAAAPIAHPASLEAHADQPVLAALAEQLEAYFAGHPITFDLPLDCGGTPFQHAVWAALRAIPYAQTRSYSQIAAAIDRPRAARAVGAAAGKNPLPVITPCHRVLGARGELTGFAGGLAAKQYLLGLEHGQPTLDLAAGA